MDDVRAFGAATQREKMIILRPDGTRAAEIEGTEHQVDISHLTGGTTGESLIAGNLLVHDHPVFGELSIGDLGACTAHHAAGIVAVMPDGSWSFGRGLVDLPSPAQSILFDFMGIVSHPIFEAILCSAHIFRDHGVKEQDHRDENYMKTVPVANRNALSILNDAHYIKDYRLHLNEQAKQVFTGLPNLDLA